MMRVGSRIIVPGIHFWPGDLSCETAIVLSTPGAKEADEKKPASDDGGDVLDLLTNARLLTTNSIDNKLYKVIMGS
jgi:uracil-DNA glycosylase